MHGAALETAKEGARMVVRNLRKVDLFALTVFDDQALTVHPLWPVVDLAGILDIIDRIDTGSSTPPSTSLEARNASRSESPGTRPGAAQR